jgi:hypothetical protein
MLRRSSTVLSLEETLRKVTEALRVSQVEYMLTGSIAASYHGTPRSTQDIDLVVEGTEDQLIHFAQEVSRQGFYVSEEVVSEAVRHRGQFNVIDRQTAWKVDLIVRKDREFSRVEFGRRTQEEALGYPLWLATAEDVVLSKLEWAKSTGSERQIADVLGILRSQGKDLDGSYLERWARDLSVEEQWRKVRTEWKGDPEYGSSGRP